MIKKIKILIVGAGSIGKRHIRNLKKIGVLSSNLLAVDKRKDRLDEVKKLDVKKCFFFIKERTKRKFRRCSNLLPTSMHINQCILLAKQKKHLLIEKPLSHNLKDLNKLEKILKKIS